jgi:hypothetical protein
MDVEAARMGETINVSNIYIHIYINIYIYPHTVTYSYNNIIILYMFRNSFNFTWM